MNIQGSRIMFLGAGQVGIEVARQCAELEAKTLIIHCLTENEVTNAIATLRSKIGPESPVAILPSWGNVLWPAKFAHQREIPVDSPQEVELITFLYGQLENELVEGSLLYQLVRQYQPDFIVDAINTATAVGYHQSVYDTVRNALKDGSPATSSVHSIARSIPEPQLVRFVQILKQAIEVFGVQRYVKVSTTGLGGMGLNIKYTHGDLGEPGLSTKLLGKVSAAGVLHQLLWTLRHTPGFNINLVIPAALIGWETMSYRKIGVHSSKGRAMKLIDCKPIVTANLDKNLPLDGLVEINEIDDDLKSTVVASGENGDYSWHDMAAITSRGQMGCITKEEVAHAVVKALEGDDSSCVLTAMDKAQLSASDNAFAERTRLMTQMEKLVSQTNIPSPSFLNLGPKVAKLLWELEIISRVSETMNDAIMMTPMDMALQSGDIIHELHLWRQMILTVKLPIITEGILYLPGKKELTLADVEKTADMECVDLRINRMRFWQEALRQVVNAISSGNLVKFSNVDAIFPDKPIKAGETLGFWFTITGGGKKPI